MPFDFPRFIMPLLMLFLFAALASAQGGGLVLSLSPDAPAREMTEEEFSAAHESVADDPGAMSQPTEDGAVDAPSTGVPVEVDPDMLAGEKFSRGPATAKKIALTFDDGPHPEHTNRLLAILAEHDIKATFFWLGQMVDQNPKTAQAVIDAGHEIGSHSVTHKNLPKLGLEGVRKEILGGQDSIERLTGQRPRLFRPPYGAVSKHVRDVCIEDGLIISMWSIDTLDWDLKRSTDRVVSFTLENAHPGAVVLLHDIKSRTIDAVPRIIAGLREQGYTFCTMGELVDDQLAAIARGEASLPGEATASAANAPPAAGPLVLPLN